MKNHWRMWSWLVLFLCVASRMGECGSDVEVTAFMPAHGTHEEDSYLCTTVQLPEEGPLQLVEFTPLAEATRVHHMLLFGCATPDSSISRGVWNCKMTKVCPGPESDNVIYGWGRDAPPVKLPEGAGFAVGSDTSMPRLVLQVHYLLPRPADEASSGIRLGFRRGALPLSAGVWSYASMFQVPPRKRDFTVENTCCYAAAEPARVAAARVHTHTLGRLVSLERSAPGSNDWQMAYAQDPLLPQGFYALPGPHSRANLEEDSSAATRQEEMTFLDILPGDKLRATCHFDSSNKTEPVSAGHGSANEMCNLYMLFTSRLPQFQWCAGSQRLAAPNAIGAVGPATVAVQVVTESSVADLWRPPRIGLGQAGGLALDHNGTLFAFMRADREWTTTTFRSADNTMVNGSPIALPVLHLLDEHTGQSLSISGFGEHTFLLPHMVTRSTLDGSLWLTDVGDHVLVQARVEYEANGVPKALRVLRTLGTPGKPGNGTDSRLCQPTQAAIARDGTVYVGDGYCAGRVAVYDGASGALLASLTLPDHTPFRVPHSLALEECSGLLYVAEREAGYVHALNRRTGQLHASWDVNAYGLPYALRVGPYGAIHVLTWDRYGSGSASLVVLGDSGTVPYPPTTTRKLPRRVVKGDVSFVINLPGLIAPHDFVVVPDNSGSGERGLAVIVADAARQEQLGDRPRLVRYRLRKGQVNTASSGAHGGLPAGLAAVTHGMGEEENPEHGSTESTPADSVSPLEVSRPDKTDESKSKQQQPPLKDIAATLSIAKNANGTGQSSSSPPEVVLRAGDVASSGLTEDDLLMIQDNPSASNDMVASRWVVVPRGLSPDGAALLGFAVGISLMAVVGFVWRSAGSALFRGRVYPRPRIISF